MGNLPRNSIYFWNCIHKHRVDTYAHGNDDKIKCVWIQATCDHGTKHECVALAIWIQPNIFNWIKIYCAKEYTRVRVRPFSTPLTLSTRCILSSPFFRVYWFDIQFAYGDYLVPDFCMISAIWHFFFVCVEVSCVWIEINVCK